MRLLNFIFSILFFRVENNRRTKEKSDIKINRKKIADKN